MKYIVGIPCVTEMGYARATTLADQLLDFTRNHTPPDGVVIIDNYTPRIEKGKILPNASKVEYGRKIIIRPGHNWGVAKSWNYVLELALGLKGGTGWHHFPGGPICDYVVLLNDDLEIGFKTMRTLLLELEASNDIVAGPTVQPFSCVALKIPQAFDEIGLFDERFYPAYFEDDDYLYRMKLAGYPDLLRISQMDLEIGGKAGQSSVEANEDLRKQIELGYENNRVYYEQKWGGPPMFELFTKPFDASSARWWKKIR